MSGTATTPSRSTIRSGGNTYRSVGNNYKNNYNNNYNRNGERGYGVGPAPITGPPPPVEPKLYSEDDDFTPSVWHLAVLVFALAAVGAGVGVGIYFAHKNLNPTPTPSPTMMVLSMAPSVMPPSIAPSVVTPPPTEGPVAGAPSSSSFVCNICGDIDGSPGMVTNPDVELNLPTLEESVTCQQLEMAGQNGLITAEQCPLIPTFVATPCGCNATTTSSSMSPTSPDTNTNTTNTTNTTEAPLFVCPLCGDGTGLEITILDGNLTLPSSSIGGRSITCGDLRAAAEKGSIDPNTCFLQDFLSAVQENCGCAYICNLCGDGGGVVTKPDGVVELPLGTASQTCGALLEFAQAGELNQQECELLQPIITDPTTNACGCQ